MMSPARRRAANAAAKAIPASRSQAVPDIGVLECGTVRVPVSWCLTLALLTGA